MKLSDLKQLIKEELLAEAKKDKSGLPFALAANIEKYGKPQTPKGAKPVDFTKKQEKRVKKTAEKLKKSIKEVQSEDDFFDVLIDMAIKNKIATSKETNSDKFRDALYDVWDEMGFKDYEKTGQGISTSDYNRSLELLSKKLKKSIKENKDNYMFFQNLETIKQMVDELLKLDEKMVDGILASGHDWAEDHIATSKDDIEEVHNFLMTKKVVGPVGMDSEIDEKLVGGQKKLDANKNGKIDAEDFKLLKAKKK